MVPKLTKRGPVPETVFQEWIQQARISANLAVEAYLETKAQNPLSPVHKITEVPRPMVLEPEPVDPPSPQAPIKWEDDAVDLLRELWGDKGDATQVIAGLQAEIDQTRVLGRLALVET